MIIDALMAHAQEKAGERRVADVRAGLGYTAVSLEDDACGVAYTFRTDLGGGCGVLGEAGRLTGMSASELIPWAGSKSRLKAAIGLAAVNAVLNTPEEGWGTGNVTTALEVRPYSTVGMVGAFRPILMEISKKTDSIYVFEEDTRGDDTLFPSETIPRHLPKCDVVVLTATSLINHTADAVLSHCKNARQVVIVGASTPLCAPVFYRYNVHLLAGAVVTDTKRILEIVSQGGGTMAMKPATKQVLVKV